LLTTLTWFFG